MRLLYIAALSSLVLSACGGGSSNGSAGLGPTIPDNLAKSAAEIQGQLAETLPDLVDHTDITFGSVVASVGTEITGIDSSFDGNQATVTIQRQNKSPVTLDTANTYSDFGSDVSLVGKADRQSRTRYTFSSSANHATVGLVAIDWKSNDSSDYLAGGYWIHAEADPASIEFGAFVEGAELDLNNPPTLPSLGTATYTGTAAGMYASEYGTDFPGVSQGTVEFGEFNAVANMTADFDNGTISGCAGCIGGTYLYPVDGNEVLTNYQIRFGATPINQSQTTFQGPNVTLANTDIPITQSSGVWAGQFSNQLENGDPRAVAGTFAGEGSTAGGSRGVFVGAFAAGN